MAKESTPKKAEAPQQQKAAAAAEPIEEEDMFEEFHNEGVYGRWGGRRVLSEGCKDAVHSQIYSAGCLPLQHPYVATGHRPRVPILHN